MPQQIPWPSRGKVWIYMGADWTECELLRIENGAAVILARRAGSRAPVEHMTYAPRNVRKEKPKKGESYL
jgi:hypothetical protein